MSRGKGIDLCHQEWKGSRDGHKMPVIARSRQEVSKREDKLANTRGSY